MGEFKKLRLDKCTEGMVIAEPVYNQFGAVILSEGTILDRNTIQRLGNIGVYEIKIKEEEKTLANQKLKEIVDSYNEDIHAFKDIVIDISNGKPINQNKMVELTDSIFSKINDTSSIIMCMNMVRNVDDYTYNHCINVSMLCMLIAKWLHMDESSINKCIQAGFLHDIGKALIPQDIINKPDKLTKYEFDIIKKHSEYGYKVLQKSNIDPEICEAILLHHEREDGSGYPFGFKGAKIPELAKIIGVADTYDAMTSKRIYKQKESPFEVFEMFQNKSFNYLDTKVVRVVLVNLATFYIGEKVKLSNGQIAEIIYIYPENVSRPLLKQGEEYIDLKTNKALSIVSLV